MRRLWFCSSGSLGVLSRSTWQGERMIQYRLLYSAPLDVVYTSNNTIVAIYTSYE